MSQAIKSVVATVAAKVQKVEETAADEAHDLFHSEPGHQNNRQDHAVPGIVHPGAAGVVYVTDRAQANGFSYGAPGWANFGQGAPEVGDIPGAVPKPKTIDLESFGEGVHEYAPTTGTTQLRKAVAEYYNTTFRADKASKFTHENVAIVPGGRSGIARVLSVVAPLLLTYQVPDYAAYADLLSCFKNVQPIPQAVGADKGYKLDIDALKAEIIEKGVTAMLMSNPRNPTGQLVEGEELKRLVEMSEELDATLLLDEFYSWYLHEGEEGRAVSAAEYIDDLDESNVILVDGLTKNWRCPGWRICWVVAPRDVITAVQQAGSYLDGGASHPMQALALQMLEPQRIVQDRLALQRHFRMKRNYALDRLDKMGLHVEVPPQATFYIWLDVSSLPEPLNSGLVFFEECLKHKVIVTPGVFFNLSPSHLRNIRTNPCFSFVRLSFGPQMEQLQLGLDGIEEVVKKARSGHKGLGKGLKRREGSVHLAGLGHHGAGS